MGEFVKRHGAGEMGFWLMRCEMVVEGVGDGILG